MMALTISQHTALACLSLCTLIFAAPGSADQGKESCVVLPAEARIRQQGDIRDDGTFSFWTNGIIGDWFTASGNNTIRLTVTASGRTVKGEDPLVALEMISIDGKPQEIARFSVVSGQYEEYHLDIPISEPFFGLQLRHLNRVASKKPEELRHLILKELRVAGAELAEYGLPGFIFFGSRETMEKKKSDAGKPQVITTKQFQVEMDAKTATWSVEHDQSDCKLEGISPILNIKELPVELDKYDFEHSIQQAPDHKLDDFTKVVTRYHKAGALDIVYTLLISNEGHDIIAQVDFVNNTGGDIIVNSVAPMAIQRANLGGRASSWTAIGDMKRYSEPYETVTVGDISDFECWWYLAIKNRETRSSILLGSLTNMKGIGRFILMPGGDTSMRIAAYSDYEGIIMPAGERIVGEKFLLNFGQKGTDSLERFGELVAKAHDIDLMKQHPINPYVPEYINLFATWNGYGAGVVIDFDYKHDKEKYEKAFMDRQWTSANWTKVFELGLHNYGYASRAGKRIRGAPSPLARRYGKPDFWFKEAQEVSKAHPEYYIDDHIDFSNPAVVEFERERAQRAFQDKESIVRYGWDFSDRWRKLPGQYDPFMTSAETYRTAMGIWRDLARNHPPGAYAFIYMNVVGFNYDICDILRAGQDSDQAYYGQGCTFTHGLVRQISGRYFYNGKVWWNNADSFHVYVGGLYSYNQGKVHASFCSITGNIVFLSEPFTDQDTPEDRLEIIRRVAPITPDVSVAVDVFEHNPARLWNMPIKRDFAEWNVVGLFNVDYNQDDKPITQRISFEALELSPDREYLVYEFWGKKFLGAKKGSFTRTLQAPDCEIYSIVEKTDHPVLISTSRNVRQMAYDILRLEWDDEEKILSGTSRVVEGDPYQLRVFVPEGYAFADAEAGDLTIDAKTDGAILTVDFKSPENADAAWAVTFREN